MLATPPRRHSSFLLAAWLRLSIPDEACAGTLLPRLCENAFAFSGGTGGNRTRASWFCRPLCYHFTTVPYVFNLRACQCVNALAMFFAEVQGEINERNVFECGVFFEIILEAAPMPL